jgi:1L-myo-inositol 1-phosphate cytidylyltransferase / CDP-L-myo-inositol myo-inositolphosphotransferase
VLPPASSVDRALASLRVAGLPLVRRLVLAAASAGYARVFVDAAATGEAGALAGTPALVLPSGPAALPATSQRIVAVPVNVVAQTRWLRTLLETPIEREKLYVDVSFVAIVQTERVEAVMRAVRGAGVAEALERLRAMFDEAPLAPDAGGVLALRGAGDAPRAERWLLRSLIKQNEGFMSRHVERRISLAVTRRLVGTSVTPNMMTLFSIGVGLGGAACFLSAAPAWQLTGALLFLAHSILDGCDGELARLKFLESRWGAVLDFWGDNVVHVSVFCAIAAGWSARSGSAWPLGLGAIAVLATLGSASLMFERTATDRPLAGAWTSRLVGALSNRDFIYIVVLLAAFGQAHWFLMAAAVGTPAFLLLALRFGR